MKNNLKFSTVTPNKSDLFRNLQNNIVNNVERKIFLSRMNRIIQNRFEENRSLF